MTFKEKICYGSVAYGTALWLGMCHPIIGGTMAGVGATSYLYSWFNPQWSKTEKVQACIENIAEEKGAENITHAEIHTVCVQLVESDTVSCKKSVASSQKSASSLAGFSDLAEELAELDYYGYQQI